MVRNYVRKTAEVLVEIGQWTTCVWQLQQLRQSHAASECVVS